MADKEKGEHAAPPSSRRGFVGALAGVIRGEQVKGHAVAEKVVVEKVVAPAAAPAPPSVLRTYEDWVQQKLPCAFDMRTGRATGVIKGKRINNDPKSTSNAAIANAARSHHRIAIGQMMSEVDFDKAIEATRAIVVA